MSRGHLRGLPGRDPESLHPVEPEWRLELMLAMSTRLLGFGAALPAVHIAYCVQIVSSFQFPFGFLDGIDSLPLAIEWPIYGFRASASNMFLHKPP